MTRIGQRLRQERTRLGLSQSALGAIGGVETNAQGNYESGARFPKADYLLRVSGAGVDVNFVITGLITAVTSISSIDHLLPAELARDEHLEITAKLHRHLQGIIEALYQMTLLVESLKQVAVDRQVKYDLQAIKAQAESIATATIRLILVSSRLA
jgi:transcriptional regulator with XRE-family HTH domain